MTADTPYDLIGGDEGVRALVTRFYDIMAEAPEAARIRAMHGEDLGPIREKLFGFLRGWMGGPRDYFQRPDAPCIMSLHHRYAIGAPEREQWLACMRRALEDTGVSRQARDMLEPAFERISEGMTSV